MLSMSSWGWLFMLLAQAVSPDVLEREQEWLRAYEACDELTQQRLLDENFVLTLADGTKKTKQDVVEQMRTMKSRGCPEVRYSVEADAAEKSADRVEVTGRVTDEQKSADGRVVRTTHRFRNVWRREPTRWQLMESTLSK